MPLAAEIRDLLASHAGQAVDFVAIYMFLNTVAGGHYEERHSETDIVAALQQMVAAGTIEAWEGERRLLPPMAVVPGQTTCSFRLGSGV